MLKLEGMSTAKIVLFHQGSTELRRWENCVFVLPVTVCLDSKTVELFYTICCVPLSDIISFNTTTTAESTITRRSHANNILVPFARTDTYQHSFGPNASISGITYLITSKKYLGLSLTSTYLTCWKEFRSQLHMFHTLNLFTHICLLLFNAISGRLHQFLFAVECFKETLCLP